MLKRDLLILGLVGFVTSFGAHSVAVNLPIYAELIGAGTFAIGLLIAVYDFAEVIVKPLFGYLADKRGQVITLWAGLGIFSVSSFLFPFIDPSLLLLIRLLQGLGAAAFSVVSVALVAAYFTTERRGQALGIYNALKGAGYVVAPVLGGLIVAQTDFSGLFVASGIVGVVVLGLSLFLREPATPAEWKDDDDDFSLREFLAPFTDPRLLPWYAVIVVNMFLVGILFGFVPVYLDSLGYGPFEAGLVIGAGTLAYLLVQPPAGRLADRVGSHITILAGLATASISILVMTFTQGPLLVALIVLGGLGIGVVWTNSDAMVSQLAKSGQLSASLGTAGSYKEIGDMLGPITIGGISQLFGLVTGFVTCGLLGLAGAAFILRKGRNETSAALPRANHA